MAYTLGDIGNAPGQAYDWAKRQFISLTKPSEDDGDYSTRSAAIARQQKLAEALSQMGQQEQGVYTAGGITAPMSPMGALARGLTSFGGAYMSGKAAADEAGLKKAGTEELVKAVSEFGKDYKILDKNAPDVVLGGEPVAQYTMKTPSNQEKMGEAARIMASDLPGGEAIGSSLYSNVAKQQSADIELQRKLSALGPLIKGLPADQQARISTLAAADPETALKTIQSITESQYKTPTPSEVSKLMSERDALPPNDPRRKFYDQKLAGTDSPEKVAQMMSIFEQKTAITSDARQKQYSLSDQENDALFGPNGAVTRGLINPDRINSRTGRIFAKAAISNPDLNMVNAAGVAALMKNPTFQNKVIVADTIPAIVENVKQAGQKVDFSDINYIGKLQAWEKKQLNDPDFINYIGQRNDAVQSIASVMRGVGMSDKSVELELAAAPLTMSPKAFDAWAAGQLTSLKPRLEKYQGVTLNTNAPGGQRPVIPAPKTGAAAASKMSNEELLKQLGAH